MKKKNAATKKEANSSRKGDQFGVVLENINSKLDLVLESYDTLDKKVDRLHLEAKEDLNEFKAEMRVFQKVTTENFEKVFKFQDEATENFEKIFKFQDEAAANFKVTLEYLSRLDDEIQSLREEMKSRPALAKMFEKRLKAMEKDLALCKKALALG